MIRSIFAVVLSVLCVSFVQGQSNSIIPNNIEKNVSEKALNIAKFKIHSSKDAQSNHSASPEDGNHFCGAHTLTNNFLKNNGYEEQYQEFREELLEAAQNYVPTKALRGPIPVIFHIVHNPSNPSENVPYSTVQSYMDILNEDFQLLNSDAVTTHTTTYGFTAANVELSFCLATQDPSGNTLAEPGVERVTTTEGWYDSNGGEENKMKQASTGGADAWPREDYINVWICDITNGASSGTAGYAYLPSNFIPVYWDGIVIDYQLSTPSSRTLTHEMGHFLGLNHTWEGTGSGACGDDDGLTDTPFTAGPFFNYSFGCPSSISTCGSIETQYENFMDYSNCYALFTQEQANVMNATMNSTVADRSSLLLSDKCNAAGPPVCAASASVSTITVGGSVDFFDNSSGLPDTWSWDFGGGGTPGTSTMQNPTGIVFNTIGSYTITLTASNSLGSCNTTLTINVIPSSGCDTLSNISDTMTLTIYGSPGGGYVTGVNAYGDLAKAERYSGYSPYTHVTGGQVYLFNVKDGGNSSTLDLVVWDDVGGLPGTELGRASYDLLSIETALGGPGNQGVLNLLFNSPVNVAGADFFLGVDFASFGNGDTIGVVQNLLSVGSNTGYEQWNDATWYDMETAWGAGNTFSLYINPLVTDVPVQANVSANPSTVCAGQPIDFNGTASIDASGYSWFFPGGTPSTGSNGTETVTYSAAGTYMNYFYALGACNGQDLDSVQVVITNGPTVSTVSTDPSCAGNDGEIDITVTGGSGSYEYSIDGGTTFQSTGVFTGLSAGTYDVVVNDISSGCSSTDAITITGSATSLTVTTVEGIETCSGNDGSIDITASGGSGSYEYSIDGGVTFQTSPIFTGLTGGTYTVVVNDLSVACSGSSTSVVNVSTTLSLSSNSTDPTCVGADGTITITIPSGSGSYEFSIDGGATFQSAGFFSGLSGGTYNVVVNDLTTACSGTDVLTLAASSGGPTASASASSNSICEGDPVTIASSGGTSYSWSTGQTTASFTDYPTSTTTYIVFVEDASGCSDSATVTVTVSSVPVTTVTGDTSICQGDTVVLTANGGTDYFWNTSQTTQSITVSPASTTTYSVVASDGPCTGSLANSVVTVLPTPNLIIDASATTVYISLGASVDFSNIGSPAVTYLWDFGDGATSTSISPTHVYTTAGTYTVTLSGTLGSCTGTDTITIIVLDEVGINENASFSTILMYPNPTPGLVQIEMANKKEVNLEIQILDAIGNLVMVKNLSGVELKTTLNLTENASGIYLVRFLVGNEQITRRLFVIDQ